MPPVYINNVVPTLDGLTAVIAAFVLYLFVRPELVKQRPHFTVTFGCLLGIVVLYALRLMLYNSPGFQVVTGALTAILQAVALVMLAMCTAGLSARQLAGDAGRAYEVIRRGEDEKEVIIPLTGQEPAPRDRRDDGPSTRTTLD